MNFGRKTFILGILTISLLGIGFLATKVQAANPDAFLVEVVPSSFDVNEAVDITIKAVTADGSIIKDYLGDIFIEIEGIVDTADYTVPSDGLYTFLTEDQGMKLFSKGLTIKRSGTFAVKVSDIINDTIIGERTIIVGSTPDDTAKEEINIISPVAGGIEKNSIANVLANVPSLPNAPYQIYVNNISVSQGMTTSNGDISAYVSGIQEGDNILQIKVMNASNEVIGESNVISFKYEPINDGVFNSITIDPTGKLKQGQIANFTVKTSDSVTSAQLKLSDGKNIPMEKQTAGTFTKEINIDSKGQIQIDVDLIVLGQTKSYTGVANLFVEEGVGIGKIRIYSDSIDKTKLNVTRETIGTIPQYRINYGTSENNLNLSVVVQTEEVIIENLAIGEMYYFQITPLDDTGTPMGTASEITETKIGEESSCVVVGITITTGQVGDKYYLMRDEVQNVEKYIIYRSDFETNDASQMQKIGETTGTMFEYPFTPNPASRQYKYAYYVVEAACKDGTNIKIDNTKKIVVGPAENIMLIILISLFGYITYRLYNYSKS